MIRWSFVMLTQQASSHIRCSIHTRYLIWLWVILLCGRNILWPWQLMRFHSSISAGFASDYTIHHRDWMPLWPRKEYPHYPLSKWVGLKCNPVEHEESKYHSLLYPKPWNIGPLWSCDDQSLILYYWMHILGPPTRWSNWHLNYQAW